MSSNVFQVQILSPSQIVLKTQATMVTAPGYEGEVGIMANHVPMAIMLRAGIIEIHSATNEKEQIEIKGGILRMNSNNECIILLS